MIRCYVDITTVANYIGEYQGSIHISDIDAAAGVSNVVAYIPLGGNLHGDGAEMPKFKLEGGAFGISGRTKGTYRMYFYVIYTLA